MKSVLRSLGIAVGLVAVLGACTSGANDTTTTSTMPTTTATTEQPTTSTVKGTSTTTPVTTTTESPWSIDYPLDAETVADLPTVLTDRIGAPEPDPDLSVRGPEDVERWVDEWLGWFSWVNANPAEGIEVLEHGVVPGSTFYEQTAIALQDRAADGMRLLGFAFLPLEVSGTFDEFFERREVLRLVVVAADAIPGYVVDQTGSVVAIHEPLGGQTTLRLLLRYSEGEEEWILENLEVVG